MAFVKFFIFVALIALSLSEDDLKDFEFTSGESKEVMIAQESRQYQTIVKPPVRIVKPSGVTNSHRPQYNQDSLEELEDFLEPTRRSVAKDYKPQIYKLKSKEATIREAVLRALERKDHVGKFAQLLPIVRSMSENQRVTLASLVASQVTTPPGKAPLNLSQVRSMFGNDHNTTTDLMLPILLDMANLIRRAIRPGKEIREVKQPQAVPTAQMLRRSFTDLDEEPFETGHDTTTKQTLSQLRIRRIRPQRVNGQVDNTITTAKTDQNKTNTTNDKQTQKVVEIVSVRNETNEDNRKIPKFSSTSTSSTTTTSTTDASTTAKSKSLQSDKATQDLAADSTNQTLASDLPIAEKLRAFNRYIDRNGNVVRRGLLSKPAVRRTTVEPTVQQVRRRLPVSPAARNPPPVDHSKCELFTNTVCLHAEDYPTDAILLSIRRNKAAAGALLADFREQDEGGVDGVTAAQEATYTAEHYLVSNRRGDTAKRDFASAGEAGFMCPSTVKYARPQRARATSGQWKYIVNTGEHTQTLRLEKCLKPKEACTYLTDNFKSKCVQVYNYHRLLTWDQQNGLHMDIFKVPTCCSCHIEGYSVAFPPLGHRVQDTSSEQFPGEEINPDQGNNNAFETGQSSMPRPSVTKSPPFTHKKPLELFPPFTDNHNLISGSAFNTKLTEDEYSNLPSSNPMDSYGNNYFPDSFNQATSIRNFKRPLSMRGPSQPGPSGFDSATLPSYLEPPTPSAPGSFTFLKETPNTKFKHSGSQFKRGVRPSRRPIRKKISGAPDDLVSSGTSAVGAFQNSEPETLEDFNDDLEEPDIQSASTPQRPVLNPKLSEVSTERVAIAPKLQEQNKSIVDVPAGNGARVNYNYHPIIDFFGNEEREAEDASIDREDSEAEYIRSSEWKPINQPHTRQTTNAIGRKKHK